MVKNYLSVHDSDVWLSVHVQPGAKTTQWSGLYGEAIKIRLSAPPVDGKANDALCRFLANELVYPYRDIEVIRGHTSRQKTICFRSGAMAFDRLQNLLDALI